MKWKIIISKGDEVKKGTINITSNPQAVGKIIERHGWKVEYLVPNELPILNCPDEYLHERELVIKAYALQNGLPEEESKFLISIVESAMSKHGIIFYRP